jgi:hypothetical protein
MLTRENTNYDVFDEEKYESIDLHNKNQNHIHNQLNAEVNGISINHYCCYFVIFISVLGMLFIIYYFFY